MNAQIEIENSKTQKVETIIVPIIVPIIKYEYEKDFIFDLSNITEYEYEILANAVNDNLKYTDIEMFFVDMKPNIPNFGPDYGYKIENNKLYGSYTRNIWLSERNK